MRHLIPLFVLMVFLAFVVGVNIYLSKRFSWYFGISHINRMYLVFALGTVFMIGGLMVFTNSVSPLGRVVYLLASISMGFTLYLIMSVLLVDLVHFLVRVKPVYYGITAVLIALIVTVFGIWHSYNLKTTSIEVPIKGITKEIRALHISDIHLGHFRGKNFIQKIADATKRLDIDVVFLTGDLYDGKIQLNTEVISPFQQLEVPIYFVEGNHDGYTDSKRIKQELRETGIIVLENEVTNWGEFQIIGLDYMPADSQSVDMHTTGQHSTMEAILPTLNIDKEKPSILLHHSPVGIKYANKQGVDLYLAGHTHGGQLFPVNYIAKLMFPYYKGLYEYNGTNIYVSQGTGTFGPPLRVGTRSELTVIILKPDFD
jgi:predicted MPP superfamily phosphohydrolase